MKNQNTREILIERTITVIAEEGIGKTTTKAITAGTGINEVYIYRLFENKEHLMACAFDVLDAELVREAMIHSSTMYMPGLNRETRCRIYFKAVWDFMLLKMDRCLAFLRYYYSPYFMSYSMEDHKKRYQPLIEKVKPSFKDEANVWLILNHILNVMLDFAVKVYNGQMPEDDDYSEHVFRVIYASVKQYFKDDGDEN